MSIPQSDKKSTASFASLAAVLNRLSGVKRVSTGWTARCPAHEDRHNSLSVNEGDGGRLLLFCHAGCSFEQLTAALGSEVSTSAGTGRRIAAVYPYRDEAGELLYEAVRFEPKDFLQRRPDGGGGHVWNLNGVRRVLYRLPELLSAAPDAAVFIPEGEKDCERLAQLQQTATTNAGGAGKWRAEYGEHLRGRDVVILPDNDEPGRAHAVQVARALSGIAASLKIVELPGLQPKGDVSDWLSAGGTLDDLLALAHAAPQWSDESTADTSGSTSTETKKDDSSLRVVRMSEVEPEQVEWLWHPYIPLGKLTMLYGEEGIGKSWLLCALARRISRGEALPFSTEVVSGNVLLLSGSEDGLADTIRPRLDSVGADCSRVFAVNEPFTFDQPGLIRLAGLIAELQPLLVVIDPLFDYVAARTDINRDNESRAATRPLREIAERHSCAIVAVRHIGKSKGNGEARAAGLGGIGFRAAGRSGLLVGCDPQDRTRRALVLTKSNLADINEAKAVGFTIKRGSTRDSGEFYWLGESHLTAESILARLEDQESRNAQTSGAAVLRDLLHDGARAAKEVQMEMRAAGFTDDVIRRARERLGIKPRKEGGDFGGKGARWMWQLPAAQDGTEDGIHSPQDGKINTVCHLVANEDNKDTYSNNLPQDGNSDLSCHLVDGSSAKSCHLVDAHQPELIIPP